MSNKPLMEEGVPGLSTGENQVTKVTVEEVGFFRKAIPTMPRWLAWVCLWLNLIPGLGKFAN